MKYITHTRRGFQGMTVLWLPLLLCCMAQSTYAQSDPKKAPTQRASKYSSLPSGYSQVDTTQKGIYVKNGKKVIVR